MTATEGKKVNAVDQLLADRQELVALCKTLTPEEWNAPSLCEGWRVRDVVAHIIGGQKDIVTYFTAGSKANQKMVDKRRDLSTAELLRQLEEISSKPSFLLKIGGAIFLYDNWVHQQDIRWPLHKKRTQNPERLKIILNVGKGRASKNLTEHNQKLVATDMNWQLGEGSNEIKGSAEALAMFLARRREAALQHLSGPGVDKLK